MCILKARISLKWLTHGKLHFLDFGKQNVQIMASNGSVIKADR